MSSLQDLLDRMVTDGLVPGAIALVAEVADDPDPAADTVEVAAAGSVDLEGSAPMTTDTVTRWASITKPVLAALTLTLVQDGTLALDAPIARWLPELAEPRVVRTPDAELTDTVPAERPITVEQLLTFTCGWGFPGDFSLPAVTPLFADLLQGPPQPQSVAAPDDWVATLAAIPLLHQPGERWLYNLSGDLLGVLLARAAGRTLPELFAERMFRPLGMTDAGFAADPARLPSYYERDEDGGLRLLDRPDGQWSTLPAFASGAGGLVGTAADGYAFGRMLLRGGLGPDGVRVLTEESVAAMMTDHTTPSQREGVDLFLDGQGWGYGGGVDTTSHKPWNVPGRYGWVGGTGTAAYVVPAAGGRPPRITLFFSQVAMGSPSATETLETFFTHVA